MYSLQICMRKWPRSPCSMREAIGHRAGALTWYPPTYTKWIVDEYSKTVWVCQFWLKCFKFCSLKNSFRGLKKVGNIDENTRPESAQSRAHVWFVPASYNTSFIWKRFDTKSIYVYYVYVHEGKQRHRQGAGTVNCIWIVQATLICLNLLDVVWLSLVVRLVPALSTWKKFVAAGCLKLQPTGTTGTRYGSSHCSLYIIRLIPYTKQNVKYPLV